jgi:hypothetical protein
MAYGKNNTKKAPQRETTPPALIAWHVAERGEKKFWNRIGGHGTRGRRGPDPAARPAPGHRRPDRSPQTEGGRSGLNGEEPGSPRLLFLSLVVSNIGFLSDRLKFAFPA